MNTSAFTRLEDVVLADDFPEVDLALRRGQHIDRDAGALYSFLIDAQDYLESFYRRYGCELIQSADGFFYLLPTSDRLGRRHLSAGEMLVGQALTLLYLDPGTVEQGGLVTRDQLLGYLAGLMGTESLLRMFNRKRRRIDERVAEESVRSKVGEALRKLATLGFIEIVQDGQMRLRPALMRFAEPVRGSTAPEAALERLVAKGELILEPTEDDEAEQDPEDVPEDLPLDPDIYDTAFDALDEATFEPPRDSSENVDFDEAEDDSDELGSSSAADGASDDDDEVTNAADAGDDDEPGSAR